MSSPSDPTYFRNALGHYPTGVSIVTAVTPEGQRVGMTVGTFNSVSLAPPLVSFYPDKTSSSWSKLAPLGRFCVNVLAFDQEPICRRFTSKVADKFEGIAHSLSPAGMPIIDDVVAWFDCDKYAEHDAGDHVIVLGQVHTLGVVRQVHPLLFLRGGYGRFAPLV